MKPIRLIFIFLIVGFHLPNKALAFEKDSTTINLKVSEIIEFENFFLLLGGKNDDIYRVILDKDIS